jgi:hypothetical protein
MVRRRISRERGDAGGRIRILLMTQFITAWDARMRRAEWVDGSAHPERGDVKQRRGEMDGTRIEGAARKRIRAARRSCRRSSGAAAALSRPIRDGFAPKQCNGNATSVRNDHIAPPRRLLRLRAAIVRKGAWRQENGGGSGSPGNTRFGPGARVCAIRDGNTIFPGSLLATPNRTRHT